MPDRYGPEYHRDYYRTRRAAAVELLGGQCARCGFADDRALQIDHVEYQPGGREAGYTTIRRVLQGHPGYQLLCANCNQIKRVEEQEDGHRERRAGWSDTASDILPH